MQDNLEHRATLFFIFPTKKDESWNQVVYVFIVKEWDGTPTPEQDEKGSVEIEPKWFGPTEIPYSQMWDDAHYWRPKVLNETKVHGEFLFNGDLKVIDYKYI